MNKQEHLLTILSEECSEAIQDISKALRFGLDDCRPGTSVTNKTNIETELAHIIAMVEMLQEEGLINKLNRSIITRKKYNVYVYFKYLKERGTLECDTKCVTPNNKKTSKIIKNCDTQRHTKT